MVYKCLKCGHLFEDGEEGHNYETIEYGATECAKKVLCCPMCEGEYEQTVGCLCCGSRHLKDEMFSGVCDECIDNSRKDFDLCYKIADQEKEPVEINALLTYILKPSEIESILYNYIKQTKRDVDCEDFINSDRSWFAEKLEKEVLGDENTKG